MPRRNLHLILLIAIVSLICYRRADSEYRSRYGQMFETFTDVMREIETHYVDEVDARNLFEGALEGMVGRLDRYSAFIGEDGSIELRETLEGKFGGIGIEVSWDRETKSLTVMSPLVGTPAYEKGILPGDKIVSINGESTENFKLEDAVRRLRGEPGTEVTLGIAREGYEEPLEIRLKRAVIQVDTVLGIRRKRDGHWSYWADEKNRIGYVRITSFGEHTVAELKLVLEQLASEGMQALILDLRENSGGLLKAAVETCDLFVDSGKIVSIRGRGGVERESFMATGRAPYTDLPVVVLVNQFSASASEIVAACLQDHNRAIIAGQRTFGKGTVQNLIMLEEGRSTLKLTIASYWRPSERNINRTEGAKDTDDWGVRPNTGFELVLSDEQLAEVILARRKRERLPRPESAEKPKPKSEESAAEKAPEAPPPGDADTPASKDDEAAKPAEGPSVADAPFNDPQLAMALEYLQGILGEKPADAAAPN